MWRRRYCWAIGERMRYNKKGLSPIGLLGEILVVLAVIIILLAVVIVPKFFSTSDVVELQISGIHGDADKDGTRNFFDQCPCTFGEVVYDGCPVKWSDEGQEEVKTYRQEDVKRYNSEPVCGIAAGETTAQQTQPAASSQQKPAEQKPAEQKSEPAAFKKYRSVEIFGDAVDEEDLPHDGTIRLACTGFVGGGVVPDCHSEDDDCDGEFNPGSKTLTEGCWVMASEDGDAGFSNNCGQAKVDDGKTIPLQGYKLLGADPVNGYLGADEPKNLLQWAWKSKPEYGALLCNQGFWYGCKEANEGRNYILRNNQAYKCTGNEWIKQ